MITLKSGWMKFFQMWLKSKAFWPTKNHLFSPWWKNHFPLSYRWIYKFYLIIVRYWKMHIFMTPKIHFWTGICHFHKKICSISHLCGTLKIFSAKSYVYMCVHKAEYVPNFSSFSPFFGHKWTYSCHSGRQGVLLKIFISEDIQIKFRKSKTFLVKKFGNERRNYC